MWRPGTRVAARTGRHSNFHAMSDEEVESPRGAAADTEPEDNSGEELEGATKIRFRTKSTWKQINHFTVDGKSETDISNLIFESAKDCLQPWLPPLMDEYKKLDSDLYLWKQKRVIPESQSGEFEFLSLSTELFLWLQQYAACLT